MGSRERTWEKAAIKYSGCINVSSLLPQTFVSVSAGISAEKFNLQFLAAEPSKDRPKLFNVETGVSFRQARFYRWIKWNDDTIRGKRLHRLRGGKLLLHETSIHVELACVLSPGRCSCITRSVKSAQTSSDIHFSSGFRKPQESLNRLNGKGEDEHWSGH